MHDLGLDQVEVVEQPLGRGRHGLAAVHVVGQQAVRLAQRAGVVGDAAVVAAAAGARSRRDLDLGGQVARVVLEPLDVQQLAAQGTGLGMFGSEQVGWPLHSRILPRLRGQGCSAFDLSCHLSSAAGARGSGRREAVVGAR